VIPPDIQTTLLAAMSGICFSGIGTAYKLGQSRNVSTAHVVLGISVAGMMVTAPLCFPSQTHAPLQVWILGIVAGLSQYVTIRLIGKGLAMGSLSVVWCIVSLSFFPVIPFACLYFGEKLAWPQYLGVVAALACVLLASFGGKRQASAATVAGAPAPKSALSHALFFGLMLAAILIGNSVCNIIQSYLSNTKPLGADTSLLKLYGWLWMFVLYASITLAAVTDLRLRRKLTAAPPKWMLALGALAGVSSILGISLQNMVSDKPMSFVINGSAGIIAAALLSVLLFKERPGRAWCATIALGIVAVVLGNLR
jgi:drug/metabolite transporter (DMT)-like permease